jgi:hypothetical protein
LNIERRPALAAGDATATVDITDPPCGPET